MLSASGDATVGKSALTQAYHSDGSSFPKTYTMVSKKKKLHYANRSKQQIDIHKENTRQFYMCHIS